MDHNTVVTLLTWFVPVAGLIGVGFAVYLMRDVLGRDTGTKEMQDVASTIIEGAMAFLRRQYTTIAVLAGVSAVLIGILLTLIPASTQGTSISPNNSWQLGILTAIAFLLGATASGISGYIGMYVAVRANLRTASAARRSLGEALTVALRGGAVSGFLVVSLSMLGVFIIYFVYSALAGADGPSQAPFLIVGFGFGASFVALFAQLGGGIYTKAADVGADLVGKIEAGIPEDDPRNPAVIADLVGDNVGDCAGRGADLFESTAAENIGAMILGVLLYEVTFAVTGQHNLAWILFPLVVRAFGIIASLVGILAARVSGKGGQDVTDKAALAALNGGYFVMAIVAAVAMMAVSLLMLDSPARAGSTSGLWYGISGLVGILTSIAFVYITQYYTAGSWRPVQEIANAAKTGPATTIISGVAVGFETTALPTFTIAIALGASYWLGTQGNPITLGDPTVQIQIPGVPGNFPVNSTIAAGVFGTAVATMGMLMSCAYILAMDTFGPITDNAGGITEMSHQASEVRGITDGLDAVGNTTKALTKGYAVGSAALAAFLLFSAYLDKVRQVKPDTPLLNGQVPINLSQVEVFIGAFFGAMLVYLFSSLAIRAVGRAAGQMIEEVRTQFRNDPGIMLGTSRPNYARAVDISARAALREMIAPGLLAVATPVLVGVILGWEAVGGLLMVGTIAGVLLANVLNNSGGAWDNAKKFIESGNFKENGVVQGKGSEAHKAAVVGDTVGDPFKDTAGPSLHVLIKLLSTITLVLAPLFIR
jgi:K(+)-stimulated pyrophosphate-energized sodium pump